MASSSIVIKVKFGETLRRLNVSINEKKLALGMVMLKEKIRSLFSFGSDVEFTMTYIDEDGDAVTLAEDDDLHDVVRQSLNPLRITVSLNNSNFNGSSGNSSPLIQTLDSEISKLRDALPHMNAVRVHAATGVPPNVNSGSSTVVNPEAGGLNTKKKKKKEKQVQKVTNGVKFKDVQPPRGVDLNNPPLEYEYFQTPVRSTKSVGEGCTPNDKKTTDGVEKKKVSSFEKKGDISSGSTNEPGFLAFPPYVEQSKQLRQHLQDQMKASQVAADNNKNTNDSGSFSGWAQGMLNATSQCPYSGMPLTSDGWKRYSHDNNGMGNIFHRGVRCDGCGAHPITGPRFKSKVKDDYDLCNFCFGRMGKATEYLRIDCPIKSFTHHPSLSKGFCDDHRLRIPPTTLPHAMQAPRLKFYESKLDSLFILDVNVLDGTIMAPFTAFTKIWRMRNNGSVIWPCGSQLQWIGGDRLSNLDSVDVEIPVDGLPVNKELDIAVDFTAPELPGRYVSYWRMASPSGQKFGQRVWVLFQVDASMKNLDETSFNLNLPPVTSDMEGVNQDGVVDITFSGKNIVTDSENTSVDLPPKDQEMSFPINDSLIIDNGGVSSTMATLSAPPETASSTVFSFAEVGAALGSLPSEPAFIYSPVGSDTTVSVPTVDFSVMPPIASSSAASPPKVVVQPLGSGGQVVTDDEEQAMVEELEEMGFKKVELNKEILRMNNYDLDKSIDDLCGVLEWDPMLDELQEMGFADNEANMRLLKKNNGSIKRVVMDLINGEKA